MEELRNLDCLPPKTRDLLLELIQSCNSLEHYVLAGGSALSLRLCHRKSEDLDFFTYKRDTYNPAMIFEYIKRFEDWEIINQTEEQIDLLLNGVKVTFFDAKWDFLEPREKNVLNIAPVSAIAAMKVNALFVRAVYRDYYDLYFIAKHGFDLRKIYEAGIKIVRGLNFKLFATALLFIDDIEDECIDHLEPVQNLTMKEIREFFEEELKKLIK